MINLKPRAVGDDKVSTTTLDVGTKKKKFAKKDNNHSLCPSVKRGITLAVEELKLSTFHTLMKEIVLVSFSFCFRRQSLMILDAGYDLSFAFLLFFFFLFSSLSLLARFSLISSR